MNKIIKNRLKYTTVPQIISQRSKRWGTALTVVLPAVDIELYIGSTLKKQSKDTFTVPIPIRPQQIGKVYAIGSNDMSQCGALHSIALTIDGKIVTWGCTLGHFTKIPDLTEVKVILRSENYDIGEEDKPAYAEGLDNVNIVKIACGNNITFVYLIKVIYMRQPLKHLTIVDTAVGANHALALTREGEVYAWRSNEVYCLEYNECELLVPFNMELKHIVKLYAGAYHNFAIDDNGNLYKKVEEFAAGQHHTLAHMHDGQVFSFDILIVDNLETISQWLLISSIIFMHGDFENSVLGNNKDEDEISPFQLPDLNGLK
ncbi:regulator of chromosome condensation 1/beta-lactamase-inhibitor protein II [Glomus cerebriforme]|uniref:Regulator of chromosome condensation 1/beta-lactamase-inhibitor protein II n=1 Tax=Glomus cerebriforme TaxID=658196 RepID=A0A397SES6_9GLOM|nr:regulator of chromosome condensation 1/beta-lactamase-inhibitor protein II [Glomus cerebriforme]